VEETEEEEGACIVDLLFLRFVLGEEEENI
jgi:hypothetical protein